MKKNKKFFAILLTLPLLINCTEEKISQEEYYENVKSSKEYKVLMKTAKEGYFHIQRINQEYADKSLEQIKKHNDSSSLKITTVENFDKDVKDKTGESLFEGKMYEDNKKAIKEFYAKYPEFLTDADKQEFLLNEIAKDSDIKKFQAERDKKYYELNNR